MAPRKKRGQTDSSAELDLFSGGGGDVDRDIPPLGGRQTRLRASDPGGKSAGGVSLFTRDLSASEAKQLRSVLLGRGWLLEQRAHMEFFAKRPELSVSVYTKGPKIVVQGKGTSEFLEFILEPEVTGVLASKGEVEDCAADQEDDGGHIGVDESGKGDFFGPLVVVAVFVNPSIARCLKDLGVMDSKRIGSDDRIQVLARGIRSMPGVESETLVLAPPKYNELYGDFKNLNRMLAWGHARVIENVLERCPECPRALSDQFAHPSLIKRALMTRGRKIVMEQRTRAESDIAVAAASILARDKFVEWMSHAGLRLGIVLPKGASGAVKRVAFDLVNRLGAGALRDVAKTHFKTASEVAPDFFVKPPLPSGESLH
jgi:ribonuclease HIII